MENVLQTSGLCKKYRRSWALNGLTMNVPRGSIYGLVGKNGAGKTTLIRLLCGLQQPTSGSYHIYGADGSNTAKISCARRRMGAVVETPAIYPDMNAAENLRQQSLVLGLPAYSGISDLLKIVGLSDVGGKKSRSFSLGMKQRLGIAMALVGDPDLLLLDEPTNGLDPQGIVEIRELILKLNRERHITVLISSHILDELSRIATHYGIIDGGRMLREISAEELDAACRKCMRISVNNISVLARKLDEMGADHLIISDNEADIFSDINITSLTVALAADGCEVCSIHERDETLEGYYISLIGGNRDA